MPGRSGRELAMEVQVLRPDISILYMSGYTDEALLGVAAFDETASDREAVRGRRPRPPRPRSP